MEKSKYYYYEKSVQSVDADIDFMWRCYRQHYNRSPESLREDFCGTGKLLYRLLERFNKVAVKGVDLDSEPLTYGRETHFKKLTPLQRNRIELFQTNVIKANEVRADVIAAFNFSYFIFKERSMLLAYFKAVCQALHPQGMFFLDIFGGYDCYKTGVDTRKVGNFNYYWDCQSYDPISSEVKFAIHFKLKGEKRKRLNVFTYDWRFWSIREITEVLTAAGFKKVLYYFEGDDPKSGGGSGRFELTQQIENCPTWIAYIVAHK